MAVVTAALATPSPGGDPPRGACDRGRVVTAADRGTNMDPGRAHGLYQYEIAPPRTNSSMHMPVLIVLESSRPLAGPLLRLLPPVRLPGNVCSCWDT